MAFGLSGVFELGFSSILDRSSIVAASMLFLIQFGNILSARLEQALNGRHVVCCLESTKHGQNNQQAQVLATKDQAERGRCRIMMKKRRRPSPYYRCMRPSHTTSGPNNDSTPIPKRAGMATEKKWIITTKSASTKRQSRRREKKKLVLSGARHGAIGC